MADNLTTFRVPIVLKSRSRILLEPSGPVQACNGIAFTCTCYRYLPEDEPLVLKHVRVEDVKITIKLHLTKVHFVGLYYTTV